MLTLSTSMVGPDVALVNIFCYKESHGSQTAVSSSKPEAKLAGRGGSADRRGGPTGVYSARSCPAGGGVAQRAVSPFSRQGRSARGGGGAGFRPADGVDEAGHGEGPDGAGTLALGGSRICAICGGIAATHLGNVRSGSSRAGASGVRRGG